MYIAELYRKSPCVFSIEVFPPKKEGAVEGVLYPTLEKLSALKPDFISVTYGAGGGEAGQSTGRIAAHIQNDLGVASLAHLTCVYATRAGIADTLTRLKAAGVDNILALRGRRNPIFPMPVTLPPPSHSLAVLISRARATRRGILKAHPCARMWKTCAIRPGRA